MRVGWSLQSEISEATKDDLQGPERSTRTSQWFCTARLKELPVTAAECYRCVLFKIILDCCWPLVFVYFNGTATVQG